MKSFDLVVVGGGPGGYVAAIRAAQLGLTTALVEKDKLGGVCLNRGCIPTKAILKSAHAVLEFQELASLGINAELKSLSPEVAIKRSSQIAERMSKGVSFLMKKHNIEVISGHAKLKEKNLLEVTTPTSVEEIEAKNIILATGARYKTFEGLKHDNDRLIGAYEALKLSTPPKRIAIIGAGAIGVEFAYFWNAFGSQVHIFEMKSHLLPLEDDDSSLEVERAYKKLGIQFSLNIQNVQARNCSTHAEVHYTDQGEIKIHECDLVLIAVGMTGNIDGIGLEALGIKTERGFVVTNECYQTNIENIYAIGDLSGPPLLAHVASHEGVIAVNSIAGKEVHPISKECIPGCTYSWPQVASVGYTERELKAQNIPYKVGKTPFLANGKAVASNQKDGFIKTLLSPEGALLGAHIVGADATELIHEYVLLKTMDGVDEDIIHSIHPHPTLGEFLAESILHARGESLNF